jgi:DNA-binding IscR family transcriptional regulator
MSISALLSILSSSADDVQFDEVISVIDDNYNFTPCSFSNGNVMNEAGQNNGSCKIFAFAQWHNLTEQQTLHCFGEYYRQDVLGNSDGTDHQNIRNFMVTGWSGISFDGIPLQDKQ